MSQAEPHAPESNDLEPPKRRRPSVGNRILGGLGELFLTAGVIIALFVVWQVFWTDVTGARAADHNVEAYVQTLPESPESAGQEQYGEPPAEPTPVAGQALATMFVPRWGSQWQFPIAEGVGNADVLDAGFVGHYPQSQLPGQVGNFAIAGHRQSHAKPFRFVEELQVGDPIIIQTAQAWYVYRVTESFIVSPNQVEVIAPNTADPAAPAVDRSITLTTCHPLWSTRERWIIHGVLDYWVAREDGRPAELIESEAS